MVIAVLVGTVLVLSIIRLLVGYQTKITITHDHGLPPLPPLPSVSEQELENRASAMRHEWLEYLGRTPPIRLHVRGQSYENYRLFARKYLDQIGSGYALLTPQERHMLSCKTVADAYIADWAGVTYPNGAPMPYSAANAGLMLAQDEHLFLFVTQNANRLSPEWPAVS